MRIFETRQFSILNIDGIRPGKPNLNHNGCYSLVKKSPRYWVAVAVMVLELSGAGVEVSVDQCGVRSNTCVERREASVISRLPFSPSSGGTRIFSFITSTNTSHFYTHKGIREHSSLSDADSAITWPFSYFTSHSQALIRKLTLFFENHETRSGSSSRFIETN